MKNVEILVLQRGWVVVGEVAREGPYLKVQKAAVIRRWGTEGKGLGHLRFGPTEETILDPCGEIPRVHELTVVFPIKCDPAKWQDHLGE